MVFPQLSFSSSFRAGFRTALIYSLYGPVAAAIFRIITELRLFVVLGWRGAMAAALAWSGADRDHDALGRSLVTLTATGRRASG